MKKNMIQWFVSLCSILIFSTLATVLRWQRSRQEHSLEDGGQSRGSTNSYSRNMLMKALAIFYFKSRVEILFQEYQQQKFLRLEYESLLYKVTDFRLEVLIPDYERSPAYSLFEPPRLETRSGKILLADGKIIAVEFEFNSHARDAIIVKNSPFVSCSDKGERPDGFMESPPFEGLRSIEPQLPLTSEECRVFQQVFRYLLDISDLRKKKHLTIKKEYSNLSEFRKASLQHNPLF